MSAILLVHPDARTREAVSSILEKSGHKVFSVHDGPGALQAFRRERPEIVILNQTLPGMACYQVFAEIRGIDFKAKVLIFTVLGSGEKRGPGPAFGIRAFGPGEVLGIIEEIQNGAGSGRIRGERFTPRVLVVDDDPGVRNTLNRYLTERGYEVAAAPDGAEALPLLKRLRPHLVLLDIDMPVMNGVETLQRIRELDSQAAVMMMSGHSTVEMMERCRDYGAYDYLVKPFDFEYMEFSVYSKLVLMTI
jgi:DNA-binding response OmpR family regulator